MLKLPKNQEISFALLLMLNLFFRVFNQLATGGALSAVIAFGSQNLGRLSFFLSSIDLSSFPWVPIL